MVVRLLQTQDLQQPAVSWHYPVDSLPAISGIIADVDVVEDARLLCLTQAPGPSQPSLSVHRNQGMQKSQQGSGDETL